MKARVAAEVGDVDCAGWMAQPPRWLGLIVMGGAASSVLVWFVRRTVDESDEPLGVLALGAACVFTPWSRLKEQMTRGDLAVAAATLAGFAAIRPMATPLMEAVVVVGGVGALLVRAGAPAGVASLLLLALPVLATLQFYLGYPLRCLAAEMAQAMLAWSGWPLQVDGCNLVWRGERLVVDAPCSGVRMLWGASFLSSALAARRGASAWACAAAGCAACAAVLGANGLRVATLFFVETGMWPAWSGMHDIVGAVCFGLVAGAVAWMHRSGR